jgi:hypothetical protein
MKKFWGMCALLLSIVCVGFCEAPTSFKLPADPPDDSSWMERLNATTWRETYRDAGPQDNLFDVTRRITLGGVKGTVISRRDGGVDLFIPDLESDSRWIGMRVTKPRGAWESRWRQMEDVQPTRDEDQVQPEEDQREVSGILQRVTLTRLVLTTGRSFLKNDATTVVLPGDKRGRWADLRANDSVTLSLDDQGQILTAKVMGKLAEDNVEQLLTELKPVDGQWNVEKDMVIKGRLFDVAGTMTPWNGAKRRVVFANREDSDTLEVEVGRRDRGEDDETIRFIILGDGQELFRSPPMGVRDSALKVRVSIKGHTAISLIAEGSRRLSSTSRGVWANPKFVKRAQ